MNGFTVESKYARGNRVVLTSRDGCVSVNKRKKPAKATVYSRPKPTADTLDTANAINLASSVSSSMTP
jgi:hypothetical protein